MLGLIPRAPRKIGTARMESLLAQQDIEVTRRSIQRDLESLSQVFIDLRCDNSTKPYGWCWHGDSPLLEMPAMGMRHAVTFELLRQHLAHVLPRATVKTLAPHFSRAREVLAQNPDAKMARWPRKIRVVPNGLPRLAPNVPAPLLDRVYTALLEERRLLIRYRKRAATEPAEYEVSPLGLVLRNGTMILVCTFWDYDNVNQMLLHRMTSVAAVDKSVKPPRGFALDDYIASGAIGFQQGDKPLKLRALVDARIATGLHEAPLSKDQQFKPHRDPNAELLTATVADTTELRTWLRSHGPLIEVLSPKKLRSEMADDARATAKRYRS
jgi:predicted DNA-binding transcriptional regulator YafY